MYPVSDAFMQAIKSNTRKYYWTGTITTSDKKTYEFGNEDIVKGSGYISRQCCGNSEIELGSVYAAELGISLFCDIDRYTLDGAEIKLWFHLLLDDGSTESIPMGVFYVAEANRRIKTLELKAYDGMLSLDKSFNKGLSSAAPYEFLSLLSKACHVELAQTKEEIEALPNGTELLGIYQDNDIESWRDFLYYLAQTLGCFAVIDRYGKLSLTSYGSTPVMAIDIRHRFSSSFSDFVTRYTAVSSTNKKTETAEYYAKDPDDGLTMNLGINPLLQFGLEETRKRIINTILDVVSNVEYVPFDSETIGNPALDLGDVLRLLLDDGSTESIPMGVFYVAEANRRIKTLELKAYDGMLSLDKSFNKGLSSAAPYEFLSLLSKACHVELAQTKEEIEALPNGTELLGIYQDNDIESWRDFLYYLAQTLGCFAVIDRYGKLSLTSYGSTPVMAIDIRHRFSSSFSDFVTRYTAVSSTNKKTETAEYYAKDPDDGLTMNLGINPLLQFGLEETRKRIINTILDVVSNVEYVPFDSETIGNPALDLGDVLRFTGGHADETKQSAITSIYTKIN